MGHFEERLNQVLAGYATFLREKELALAKHQPYLVRWVREFLLFARDHGGYTPLPGCTRHPWRRATESGAERRSPKRPCGPRVGCVLGHCSNPLPRTRLRADCRTGSLE